jgi:predicted enzyme related to lactoylglutathione lyase
VPNNLASFGVHVDDTARARRFYEAVFGWRFEPWGPPDFFLIHTGDEARPGVLGVMHKRFEPSTGVGLNGFECTFSVDDVEDIRRRVVAAGGTITLEKYEIATVGTLICFRDTEGNGCRAMRYDTPPRGA